MDVVNPQSSSSSKLPCAVRLQHLEEKVARIKAKYAEEVQAREAAERRATFFENRESETRERASLAAAEMLQARVNSGTMPQFSSVDVKVIQLERKNSSNPDIDGDEDDPADVSAEQQENKEAAARDIWLKALHKAAPALVMGVPVVLEDDSEARGRVFADKSTFFLSHSGPAGPPEEVPELPDEDLGFFPDSGRPPVRYDRCALVGNARGLLSANKGEEINAHDVVMRINQASTVGYEDQVGNKTTLRLVNRKWAAAYQRDTRLKLETNVTLMCSRTTWPLFLRVARAVAARRPDVRMALVSREVVDTTGTVLRELKDRVEQVRGVPYLGKASPSSGFVGVYLLLQMCQEVNVYGVGDGMAGSWHYFEERAFADSREFGMDPHHSFELEHDMLQVLDAAGFIRHNKMLEGQQGTFSVMQATAEQVRSNKAQADAEAEERFRQREQQQQQQQQAGRAGPLLGPWGYLNKDKDKAKRAVLNRGDTPWWNPKGTGGGTQHQLPVRISKSYIVNTHNGYRGKNVASSRGAGLKPNKLGVYIDE